VPGETFGDAVRRLRLAREVSLCKLSKLAPVDKGHLSKIENNKRHCSLTVAKALDSALSAGGELVALAKAEQARRVRAAVPFDPMRRRTIVKFGLTASAAAGMGVAGSDAGPVGKVGVTDAERLRRAATRLYSLDHQHGGESLWQAAIAQVQGGYLLLEQGRYSEVVGRQLLMATGRMQICAGWLAFDAGQHTVARSCYTEALALAKQANDTEVETHALANLAFQDNILGRPRQALRFADAAARVAAAPDASYQLATMPQLRKAIASSLVADVSGTNKAVACARRTLEYQANVSPEAWGAFLTPAEMDGVEATCAMNLGQSNRATHLLEGAVAGHADRYARNRALYQVRLAHARLDMNNVDGAAEAANAALDDLTDNVTSWRVSTELHVVAKALAAYPKVPGVECFLTRYNAMPS